MLLLFRSIAPHPYLFTGACVHQGVLVAVCMDFSYCLCLNQTAVSGSSMFFQLSKLQAVIVLDLRKLNLALLIMQQKYIITAPPLTAAG